MYRHGYNKISTTMCAKLSLFPRKTMQLSSFRLRIHTILTVSFHLDKACHKATICTKQMLFFKGFISDSIRFSAKLLSLHIIYSSPFNLSERRLLIFMRNIPTNIQKIENVACINYIKYRML